MRCLALAEGLEEAGEKVVFAMASSTPAIRERLERANIEVVALSSKDDLGREAGSVISLARMRSAAWVVVDGYQFTPGYIADLKSAGLNVLSIDDLGRAMAYPSDLVLNQNAHAKEISYRERAPQTRLLLGPRYALLRREFRPECRVPRTIPSQARKILVMMGGSDPDNITLRMLDALQLVAVENLEVVILAGGSNPHVATLRKAAMESNRNIRVLCDVDNVSSWMQWADIAISAAGSTSWEICFLGLPAVLVDVAPNQTPVAQELERLGGAVHLKDVARAEANAIASAVKELMMSSEMRSSLSKAASELVDGLGTRRVVAAMRAQGLRLRRADNGDSRVLWEWANDPDVRAASFSVEPIAWNEHVSWFSNKLADENCRMYIALENSEPVGQIRLDRISDQEAEIDISVARERRGRGYASLLLVRAAGEVFRDGSFSRLHGFVRPANQASAKAFEKASFRKTGTARVRGHEALHYVLERGEILNLTS
jgi:UDP-2,4-diacetamido-2,4,6-trideoxy-beta-L-altropyranose hydrolase